MTSPSNFIPVASCILCHKPVNERYDHQFGISYRFHLKKMLEFVRAQKAGAR